MPACVRPELSAFLPSVPFPTLPSAPGKCNSAPSLSTSRFRMTASAPRQYPPLHPLTPAAPVAPRSAVDDGTEVVRLSSVDALHDLLVPRAAAAAAAAAGPVVVVKLFTRSCRACIGAAPRFRKSARAFVRAAGRQRVAFAEMDYAVDKDFCVRRLGVNALPFFAILRAPRMGEAARAFKCGREDEEEAVVVGGEKAVGERERKGGHGVVLLDGLSCGWHSMGKLDERVSELLVEHTGFKRC